MFPTPSAESPGHPTPVERPRIKRPSELEPSSKSIPTLPSIEEEGPQDSSPLELPEPSLSPHRDQSSSPSVDSKLFPEMSPTQSLESRHTPHRSRTGSLDSKCRDKSRTSSIESRLSEALGLEVPGELSKTPGSQQAQSPDLTSDLEATGPPSPPHSDGE